MGRIELLVGQARRISYTFIMCYYFWERDFLFCTIIPALSQAHINCIYGLNLFLISSFLSAFSNHNHVHTGHVIFPEFNSYTNLSFAHCEFLPFMEEA